MQKRTVINKNGVLYALKQTGGKIEPACKLAGIGKTQFHHWVNTDPDFRDSVIQINQDVLRFAYSRVYVQACKGSKKAQRMLLATSKEELKRLLKPPELQ